MRSLRTFAPLLVAAVLAVGCRDPLTSVRAPLGDPRFHEKDPADPGATGPDVRSKNVKLLANVAGVESRTSTDLAFAGRYVYAGDYGGFRVIDVSDPEHPRVVSDVACNGAQGDVSVYRNLLFQSVDAPQTTIDCTSVDAPPGVPTGLEGVRMFDVSDPASPRLLDLVTTPCGSHTHTLVPDPANMRVLVYVSSYPATSLNGPPCTTAEGFGYISIIEVSLAEPAATPKKVTQYFLDAGTESYSAGPIHVTGCHDITVFLEIERAAAACLSETQMWDISDPEKPEFLWRFDDAAVNGTNGDIWHSAAFSWDGKTVAFGDESGGGGDARCTDPGDQQGRIWFLSVATGALLGSYKIPRVESGKCTAHNFNFIPLPKGRRVLVSAYYTGGTTIVDVDRLLYGADAAESEVGVFRPEGGRVWSSYWYNGFAYTSDMLRGVDVLLLSDNVRSGARQLPYMNPQTQESLVP
jgi:hypothetical protein